MEVKLKLVLQNLFQKHQSHLSSWLKSAIFGLALLVPSISDFRLLGVLFFLLAASVLYFRPFFGVYGTSSAFLVLLAVSIFGMQILAKTNLLIPGIILFSSVFYLLVGIKGYLFVKRSRLYYIAALILFYSIFIVFFLADKSDHFFIKYLSIIGGVFLLFREWLALIPSFHFPKRELVASAVAAFLIAEILWVTSLLPIGFISAANLMLVFVFLLADFLLKHFTGGINKEFLLQHLFFFILLVLLIFWTSGWTLGF